MTLQEIFNKLRSQGYRLTPQRRLILEILDTHNHPSAEEIHEKVRDSQPNCSFSTVYRNLNGLADLGLIRKLYFRDGRLRFEINNHHHHLICLCCGDAQEIEHPPFDNWARKVAELENFKIKSYDFDIYGHCDNCSKFRSKKSGRDNS